MRPSKWNPIQESDYKDVGPWFGQFALYFNNILQPIIQILNNGILITDNVKFKEYTTNFTTDVTYPTQAVTFSFSIDFSPKQVSVSKNFINKVAAPTGVPITWTYSSSDKSITVNSISGLSASTNYDMTILAI